MKQEAFESLRRLWLVTPSAYSDVTSRYGNVYSSSYGVKTLKALFTEERFERLFRLFQEAVSRHPRVGMVALAARGVCRYKGKPTEAVAVTTAAYVGREFTIGDKSHATFCLYVPRERKIDADNLDAFRRRLRGGDFEWRGDISVTPIRFDDESEEAQAIYACPLLRESHVVRWWRIEHEMCVNGFSLSDAHVLPAVWSRRPRIYMRPNEAFPNLYVVQRNDLLCFVFREVDGNAFSIEKYTRRFLDHIELYPYRHVMTDAVGRYLRSGAPGAEEVIETYYRILLREEFVLPQRYRGADSGEGAAQWVDTCLAYARGKLDGQEFLAALAYYALDKVH